MNGLGHARHVAPGLLVLLCTLVPAAPARAIYGPVAGGPGAELVSVDNASDEQTNAPTSDAAISANGRYVVFQTRATNLFEDDGVPGGDSEPPGVCREGGIFRYDRQTGELALVADGEEVGLNSQGECEPSDVLMHGAENPSVSADGRFIAFSTAEQLVSQDTNDNADVYVRDMDVPLTADRKSSGAYKLVSAQSGSEAPLPYNEPAKSQEGGNPGSEVWPNTAISANGQYVLFRTAAEVLTASPAPPDQLFVRDLSADTTTLVTRRSSPGTQPGQCESGTLSGGEPASGADGPASLSADGSTVAWLGEDAPPQTVFLKGEITGEQIPYYLWRHWGQEGACTRRITGVADPEDPACPPETRISSTDPTATGPCYGPLSFPEFHYGTPSQAPDLSADGDTVAFLTGVGLRPSEFKLESFDVFVTSMAPGVTRKAGTRELTLGVNGARGNGNAPVTSLAISSDGTHIAFVSQRNAFVLSEPAPTGGFSAIGGASELYVIDLTTNTLERAVVGLEGSPNHSMLANPTLSGDGSTLAFASEATNLIPEDANGFSDAFTATFQAPRGTAPPPAGVNAGTTGFSLTAISSPELGVSVRRAKDGGVTLLVETPGPGKLTANARGAIPRAASAATAKKVPAGSTGARAAKAKKKTSKARPSPAVVVASGSATARSEGTTTLTLHISSRYAADLRRAGKLTANISIEYAPTDAVESALSDEVSATFVTASPVKKPASKVRPKRK